MCKLKQPLEVFPGKKLFLKFENIKRDEQYIDDDKNVQILIISFLTIPHTRGWYASLAKSLRNTCKEVVF